MTSTTASKTETTPREMAFLRRFDACLNESYPLRTTMCRLTAAHLERQGLVTVSTKHYAGGWRTTFATLTAAGRAALRA